MGLGVGRHNLETFGTLTHPNAYHIPFRIIILSTTRLTEGNFIERDNIPSLSHDKKPLGIELFHRTLFPVAEMRVPQKCQKM